MTEEDKEKKRERERLYYKNNKQIIKDIQKRYLERKKMEKMSA